MTLTNTPERKLLVSMLQRALFDYFGDRNDERVEAEDWLPVSVIEDDCDGGGAEGVQSCETSTIVLPLGAWSSVKFLKLVYWLSVPVVFVEVLPVAL